ncbi:MAG: flagellar protein FlaG [Parashewanella sp.]
MSANTQPTGMNVASNPLSNQNSAQQKMNVRQEDVNASEVAKDEQALKSNEKVEQAQSVTKEQLDAKTQELTQFMAMTRKGIAFEVDEPTGEPIVNVMDLDSGEVLRQIPSEEALKIAERFAEMNGLIINEKA